MKKDTIRVINSEDDKAYLEALQDSDIHSESLKEMFANTESRKARFFPSDIYKVNLKKFRKMADPLSIHKDEYVTTTIGRYIFNVFMNNADDPMLFRHLGYINKILTVKETEGIIDILSDKLLINEITSDDYIDFFNRIEWLGFNMTHYMTPGFPASAQTVNKDVAKRRDMLIKKHAKELEDPNKAIFRILEIEKELLTYAKEQFKDDPDALDVFKSGARGNFENNYKTTCIMRGAVLKFDNPKDFKLCATGLSEGTPEEDIEYYNDIFIRGTAGRAKDTQKGGYLAKQLAAAFQNVVLDERGSDCGSKNTVKLLINRPKDFYLRYMVEGGKDILLTPELIKSLQGKIVNLRTPMYCKNPLICNKCAGDLYYELGIMAPGLTFSNIGSSMLNLSMKLFHDMTYKAKDIDIEKYIK